MNRVFFQLSVFRIIISLLLFSLFHSQTFGQLKDSVNTQPEKSFYDMSLEELINLKASGVPSELEELINSLISVSSKKSLSTRESPSIVSLITAEEIEKMGARDLTDILRTIPGFDFGVDVQGSVGIGVRGNWAHEGKVLLMIDGSEMNEILYSTLQFGNHYPIDNIKRIEIIRGPGSAIYGGFAEYGVINIITRHGEEINGISVSGIYGQMQSDFSRSNISLSSGANIKGVNVSISGLLGKANRSDQDYTDLYGSTYNMRNTASLNPSFLNAGISYKGLSFRGIMDNYNMTSRDGYDLVTQISYPNQFKSYYLDLKYEFAPTEKLSITPQFKYSQQKPWNYNGEVGVDDNYFIYDKTAKRGRANLTANYKISRKFNMMAGGEFFEDKAFDHNEESFLVNPIDSIYSDKTSYNNYALFAEGTLRHRLVNIVLGARYDKHNKYGAAFNPRIGLTKRIKKFNFKALYANSFRAPGIENINLASEAIKPEKTHIAELEVGYQLSKNMILSVNIFDITTRNTIIYDFQEEESYRNEKESGSQGLEIEYRIKDKWGFIMANYSYYSAANKKKVESYRSHQNGHALLGIANHKANFTSSFNLTKTFTLNPSFNYVGKRYGYSTIDIDENPVQTEFEAKILANLFIQKKDFLIKGFKAGLGVYDLLNSKYKFIQPYNGGHAPLPGPSREFFAKLTYDLSF